MRWRMAGRLGSMLLLALSLSNYIQPAWADEGLTARNKAVVQDFYTAVMIARDVAAAPRFLQPDHIQHNPQVPTGLKENLIKSSLSTGRTDKVAPA